MLIRQGDIYVEVVDYPLANAETRNDIGNYRFPEVVALGRFRGAEALVRKYNDEFLVIVDIEVTVFSLAHQLVVMEKLLVDMMETGYVISLFEACAEFQNQIGLRVNRKRGR